MRDGASAHIRHDLHVAVRVRRESLLGGDLIVVPHADAAPAHASRITVAREGEMMTGVEPAVVGVAERIEFSDVDHDADLGGPFRPSSVTRVTAKRRSLTMNRAFL